HTRLDDSWRGLHKILRFLQSQASVDLAQELDCGYFPICRVRGKNHVERHSSYRCDLRQVNVRSHLLGTQELETRQGARDPLVRLELLGKRLVNQLAACCLNQ